MTPLDPKKRLPEEENEGPKVPESSSMPVEGSGLLQALGQMSTRMRALMVLAMLGTGSVAAPGCFGESQVDTAEEKPMMTHQIGNWKFDMFRTGTATVNDEHGETLYAFIRATLETQDAFEGVEAADQQKLIDAVIFFCRALNAENLDDFQSINGKTLYFPESIYVTTPKKSYLLDLNFTLAPEKDEELRERTTPTKESASFAELNQKLNDGIRALATESAKSNPTEAAKEIAEFNLLMKLAKIDSYHEIFDNYSEPLPTDLQKKYASKSAAQLQSEIEPIQTKLVRSSAETSLLKELVRVRNAKMYEELVQITNKMSPDQIKQHRLFKLTVFDVPSKHPFYDVKDIWEWKRDNRSKPKDRVLYDEVLKDLDGKDNSVTMESWLTNQDAAVAYFQKYAAELGYEGEYVKYITPALMLSVIHAEFFSEFSGRAFVDLVPYAMESTNLPYGPAINDREFSAGVVQMIRDTFRTLLNDNYEVTEKDAQGKTLKFITNVDRLRTIQAKDPSYRIVVPSFIGETRNYDAEEFTEAMTSDLNSNLFFATVAIANHIDTAFTRLMADPNFAQAWTSASEGEHYLFLASLAPLAINGGKGGAAETATRLLEMVDSTALSAYITGLPDAAKGTTRKRGAEVGLRTMTELLTRANAMPDRPVVEPNPVVVVAPPELPPSVQPRTPVTPEGPFVVDLVPRKPRVALFASSYQPLVVRARADGIDLSDPSKRDQIYADAVRNSVQVPVQGVGYRLKEPTADIDVRMRETAYEVLKKFAAEFKERSGGYSIVVTDILRSPKQQDAISISKGTHPTGYSWDNADGRFYDPSGNEITWSVKVNGQWQKGPNADLIDTTLRPLLILMLEEYQAQGVMMVYDESATGAKVRHPEQNNPKSGGHFHVSVTASNRGPVGPVMK